MKIRIEYTDTEKEMLRNNYTKKQAHLKDSK